MKSDPPPPDRPPRRSPGSDDTPPDDPAEQVPEADYVIPPSDEADEADLLKAIQDVVELATHGKPPASPHTAPASPHTAPASPHTASTSDAVPELELPATEGDDLEKLRAIQEVVELAGHRKEPSKDPAPALELSTLEAADELERTRAIKEVVEVTARRKPSAKEVTRESERPVLALRTGEAADDLEKKRAILEVLDYAERTTRAVELAKPIESYRSRPILLVAIAIPSLLLALYTFIGRPEYVFGPNPANMAPAKREAHLRFAMFLVAQRVDTYRNTHGGQLPQSLAEAGENWPGIAYRILDNSVFELRARDDSAGVISLRSDQPLTGFLGESKSHLREFRP